MMLSESSAKLTNVTFSGNSATTYGGGMYNIYSSPVLTNVTFSGNSTTASLTAAAGCLTTSIAALR